MPLLPTAPLLKRLSNWIVSSMVPLPPHLAVDGAGEGPVVVAETVVAVVVVNTPPRTMEWGDLSTLLRSHRII